MTGSDASGDASPAQRRGLGRVVRCNVDGGATRVRQLAGRFVVSVGLWFVLSTLFWQPHQAVDRRISSSLVWGVVELIGDLFFFRPSPTEQKKAGLRRHVRKGTLPDDEVARARLARYVAAELERSWPLWQTAALSGGLAAAAVVWGVTHDTGQAVAGIVFGVLLVSLVPRELAELRRLEQMDQRLDPGRERLVRF